MNNIQVMIYSNVLNQINNNCKGHQSQKREEMNRALCHFYAHTG